MQWRRVLAHVAECEPLHLLDACTWKVRLGHDGRHAKWSWLQTAAHYHLRQQPAGIYHPEFDQTHSRGQRGYQTNHAQFLQQCKWRIIPVQQKPKTTQGDILQLDFVPRTFDWPEKVRLDRLDQYLRFQHGGPEGIPRPGIRDDRGTRLDPRPRAELHDRGHQLGRQGHWSVRQQVHYFIFHYIHQRPSRE